MSQIEAPHASPDHVTVLRDEGVAAVLGDRRQGCFVDCTFGRGGHTRALLARLDEQSRVYGIDRDPQAIVVGQALAATDTRFTMVSGNFNEIAARLQAIDVKRVDGILADLGVSSPQLDQPGRGFSFMHDGPLDMRMDNQQGETAAEWLARVSETELADTLYQYGEERYSRRLARAIKQHQALHGKIERTAVLAELIRTAHPRWEKHRHPATRSFQAIRIAVNGELSAVEQFLPQAVDLLGNGGRLAVISFHSLEDRLVKQFIQRRSQPPEQPSPVPFIPCLKKLARIAPSEAEIADNPRARSAWLRVAERINAVDTV